MIDLSLDGHVHTQYCHHASGEMEEYVLAAIAKGLRKLVFLEHFETGIDYFESTWLTDEDFENYFREGKRLQTRYGRRIEIGLGVEVGYNPEGIAETLYFLDQYSWDRIGISYHFYPGPEGHINMVSRKAENMRAFSKLGVEKVVEDYFAGLMDAVRRLPGTVLCHVDAVLRHHPDVKIDAEYASLLEQLFGLAAAKKIALEINTSGWSIRQKPFPARPFIRQALAAGMRLTAGSDAHRPRDVGRYFSQLPAYLAFEHP